MNHFGYPTPGDSSPDLLYPLFGGHQQPLKGSPVHHPKNGTIAELPKFPNDGDARASWPQRLYSSVPLAGCQYHPAWWFFPLKAGVKFWAVHLHQQVSAINLQQKKLWNTDQPKIRLGSFIHTTVVGTSFIVGCLSYRIGRGLENKAAHFSAKFKWLQLNCMNCPGLIRSVSLKRGKGWFPYISLSLSLRACLLYLTPKMRTFSSLGVRFHWPGLLDERFIPQWMIAVLCERLTDFLVLSSFYMAGGAMRIEPPRSY